MAPVSYHSSPGNEFWNQLAIITGMHWQSLWNTQHILVLAGAYGYFTFLVIWSSFIKTL
jgi:hypothetical protein